LRRREKRRIRKKVIIVKLEVRWSYMLYRDRGAARMTQTLLRKPDFGYWTTPYTLLEWLEHLPPVDAYNFYFLNNILYLLKYQITPMSTYYIYIKWKKKTLDTNLKVFYFKEVISLCLKKIKDWKTLGCHFFFFTGD
jgi:hypothetical protein